MKPDTPEEPEAQPPLRRKKPTKGMTRKAFGELLKRAIRPELKACSKAA